MPLRIMYFVVPCVSKFNWFRPYVVKVHVLIPFASSCCRVFAKIFSLDQIGSSRGMAKPMYF